MTGSIGDWYGKAAGRRSGGAGYDPENDEPVERTPDAWLDDLQTPRTPEDRRAPRLVNEPRSREFSAPVALTPVVSDRPPFRRSTDSATVGEVGRVARALQARQPGLSINGVARQLRQQFGWPALTSAQVTEAMASGRGATMAEDARAIRAQFPGIGLKKLAARLRLRGWAAATPETVQAALGNKAAVKLVQQSATAGAAESEKAMARKVRAIDASAPGWTVSALTEAVRRKGWPRASEADVRKALLGSDCAATVTAPQSEAADELAAKNGAAASSRARRVVPPSARGPAAGAKSAKRRQQPDQQSLEVRLIAAVRAYSATHPQAWPDQIAKHLRRNGWPEIYGSDVTEVLRRLSAYSPPASRQVGVRKPSKPKPKPKRSQTAPYAMPEPGAPFRTLDIQPRPGRETCHGCGRAVSRLGICGCC
ncbi:hypothetical protein [Micromonospora tulbaghiae]